jgi:hypothetical protein
LGPHLLYRLPQPLHDYRDIVGPDFRAASQQSFAIDPSDSARSTPRMLGAAIVLRVNFSRMWDLELVATTGARPIQQFQCPIIFANSCSVCSRSSGGILPAASTSCPFCSRSFVTVVVIALPSPQPSPDAARLDWAGLGLRLGPPAPYCRTRGTGMAKGLVNMAPPSWHVDRGQWFGGRRHEMSIATRYRREDRQGPDDDYNIAH